MTQLNTNNFRNRLATIFNSLLPKWIINYFLLGHCAQASIGFGTHFWWIVVDSHKIEY